MTSFSTTITPTSTSAPATASLGSVLVGEPGQLGLDLERTGRIVHGHDHLHELDLVAARELLVVEQARELGLGADGVRLAGEALSAAEGLEERGPVPTYRI